MNCDSFPKDGNELTTRLHGWFSRNYWLLTEDGMSYGQLAGGSLAQSGTFTTGSVPMSVPTPISPMQEARGELNAAVSVLHERLMQLGQRLNGVCVSDLPASNGPDTANQNRIAPPSELRDYLLNQARGVYAAVGVIDSLLNRLEL